MKKKHPIRNGFLIVVLILAVAFSVNALVAMAADNKEIKDLNKQLALGVKYLEEMDYESAIVAFNEVLEIDNKNVAAYMGSAMAYEQAGQPEMVRQVLDEGIANTGDQILDNMLEDVEAGKKLEDIYSFDISAEKVKLDTNPYDTLQVLGSEYYQWNVMSAAKMFRFDYENYMGKKVDLGEYEGLHIFFDATTEDVELNLGNGDFEYAYQFLSGSELQMFHLGCLTPEAKMPRIEQFGTQLEMGTSYNDILTMMGMDKLNETEENTYCFVDSNLGQLSGIQWQDGAERNLNVYLSGQEKLGMQFVFVNDKLQKVIYSCGLPDNLRSKAMEWAGNIIK